MEFEINKNNDDLVQFIWIFNEFCIETLRYKQNGCHFPDNNFKYVFVNENA